MNSVAVEFQVQKEGSMMIPAGKSNGRHKTYPLVEIQGIKVRVPHPDTIPRFDFVEREDVLDQALAAWMAADGLPPLSFRLFGPPGVGKNAIVYQLARILKKRLYVLNGNEELDAEDIACSARMTSADSVEYVASPLFAAMLNGGIFFFDEIGKAPPGALNPLASVLDARRTLTSVLAGIHLEAHPEFLFCAALNEDEETAGRLPEFLQERLSPAIHVGLPPIATLRKILQGYFSQADERWVAIYVQEFWNEEFSPREAITQLQWAQNMARRDRGSRPTETEIREYLRKTNGKKGATESPAKRPEPPPPAEEPPRPQESRHDGEPFLVLPKSRRSKAIH
jgi:hypothetical protein